MTIDTIPYEQCVTSSLGGEDILTPTEVEVVMLHDLVRDDHEKEGRKKQARSNKQRQSNTTHPRQLLFLRKLSCLGWDSNSRQSALPTELPRQLSWLGPNLTSHSIHLMNRLTIMMCLALALCTFYIWLDIAVVYSGLT